MAWQARTQKLLGQHVKEKKKKEKNDNEPLDVSPEVAEQMEELMIRGNLLEVRKCYDRERKQREVSHRCKYYKSS